MTRHLADFLDGMEKLSILARRFQKRNIRNEATTVQPSSKLLSLPLELFHLIALHLDTVSLLCLALTAKSVHRMFYDRLDMALDFWKIETAVSRDDVHEERRDFLLLYTRDHREYYFCHRCFILHLRRRVPGPGAANQRKIGCFDEINGRRGSPFRENHLRESTTLDVHRSTYCLDFAHVQLVMDEHLWGPSDHGFALQNLEFVEMKVYAPKPRESNLARRVLASYDPLILPPSPESGIMARLVLRIQQCVFVSSQDLENVEGETKYQEPAMHFCKHFQRFGSTQVGWASGWFQAGVRVLEDEVRRCPVCCTEWSVTYLKLEGCGVSRILTKWVDLGAGRDPSASSWTRHQAEYIQTGAAELINEHEGDSLRREFEGKCEISLAQRTKNEGTLLAEKTEWQGKLGMRRLKGYQVQRASGHRKKAAEGFELWVRHADKCARPVTSSWRRLLRHST